MDVTRSFKMTEPPDRAQARVESDLSHAIEVRGFRLGASAQGIVTYTPHLVWWLAIFVLIPSLIWRMFVGQRMVTFEFVPDGDGTAVTVTGNVSGALGGAIQMLGRPGRWPFVDDDPDWQPVAATPIANPQDSEPWGDEDYASMDRIERKAYRARQG
jgi:hypothetical protein